ncbi:MAG: TIGR04372 family glycosyltransferase [Coxiellaceae bacterium]|nr:TIGR04372 family glycosyltransferase [Coxiellaceae bacterium]
MVAMLRKIVIFLKRAVGKLCRIVLFLLSIPITLVLILIYPFFKFKFVSLVSDRVGHYAMNTELLLCYLDEIQERKRTKYIFYRRVAPICNEQLDVMWKRIIFIFPFSRLASYIDQLMLIFLGNQYKNNELRRFEVPEGYQDIFSYLQNHKEHLHFRDNEIIKGKGLLLQLGILDNQKYVCLLGRDSTYLSKYLPDGSWAHHFYRDSDINNFSKAALFLAEQGYYVIRMGKSVEKSFNANHPKIIDYANHDLRSDFFDIYLSANCEFFISTATGLDAIPQIFRRPIVLVDVAPFKAQIQYWWPCEFFITKKVYDNNKKRFLSFKEIDDVITKECDVRKVINQYDLSIIENTAEEILAVVKEMEACLSKKKPIEDKNIFFEKLKTSRVFSMIADRNFLKKNPEKFYIKMGKEFTEENKFLMD